jgi:hypothetical protein
MDDEDKMTYVEWQNRGLLDQVEKRRKERIERGWLPEHVERVSDWNEVVQWLQRWEDKGRPSLV